MTMKLWWLLALHSATITVLGTSSIVFPLTGNVCPKGGFITTIEIGKPSKYFELFIDTGSHLTWVQCHEPCENCDDTQNEDWYKPPRGSIVQCDDPLCVAVQENKPNCINQTDRCEYVIDYEDNFRSYGYLVRDYFRLQLINGSVDHYPLVFGCGYKQIGDFMGDGILGLSIGAIGFASQMHSKGLIQQVIGHCLSDGEGGGSLFLGDDLVPASKVSWMPIANNHQQKYLLGPANLLFDEHSTKVNRITFKFDSGASYSYINQPAYKYTLDLINKNLKGTPLKKAKPVGALHICWRFEKIRITSFDQIKDYFKKLTLSFSNISNVKLDLPLPDYLVLVNGKVCLGILDGNSAEQENPNVIGAISMQNKLMIYDNVNQCIGWVPRDCNIPLLA